MRRRRFSGLRDMRMANNSVGNKITVADSDTLAVYLLHFVEKYSFANEVLELFSYLIKVRNRKGFLKRILDAEIKRLCSEKKLRLTPAAEKAISENMKAENSASLLNAVFGNADGGKGEGGGNGNACGSEKTETPENAAQRETENVVQRESANAAHEAENAAHEAENAAQRESANADALVVRYLSMRESFESIERVFQEDQEIFDEVLFRVSCPFFEDFARVLMLEGERRARSVMASALFRRGADAGGRAAYIPSRALDSFMDFSALKIIIDFASLNETESMLLKLFYFQKKFAPLAEIADNVNDENWAPFYATLLGLPETEIISALRKDRPLLFYGIVTRNRRTGFYELGDEVTTCVAAGDTSAFFTSALREVEVRPYALESFSCKREDAAIVQKLLQSGQSVNILLYGAPGAGKTEFAKSVIHSVGKKVLLFKNDLELDEKENAICALNRISIVNQGSDSVIVIDEADKLLDTAEKFSFFGKVANEQKGPINKMLEESKNQIVWITNYVNQMDESTKRRFTFSLKFNPMTEETLRGITASRLSDLEMSDGMRGEILDLCGRYKVTGASVDNVRKMLLSMNVSENKSATTSGGGNVGVAGGSENARKNDGGEKAGADENGNARKNNGGGNADGKSAASGGNENENAAGGRPAQTAADEEQKLSEIKTILAANSELLHGRAKMREKQCAAYDMGILNTSMDAEKIVRMISNAKRFSEKNKTSENGVRMLFYGLSGTGKTEFARYIADRLGKKILIKRASDIFDKYVGQNERNVAAAFAEAEGTGDILLFDEVDSFFYDREGASRSWERNTVNEFLTQMEEFSGILICTTNLREILDPAVNRRFHLLCEFKPLSRDGIKTLLEKYFSQVPFSDGQIDSLAESGSVTPGDFGSLASRLRFMDEGEMTAESIARELFEMQTQKKNSESYGRRIGFGM